MITLASPITIIVPPLPFFTFKPIVVEKIDWSVSYDNSKKEAYVAFHAPIGRRMILWKGEEYDAAGQFTDSQVDARVAELLGDGLSAGLHRLFDPNYKQP
jgi:hypothetical protein